jgi:MoaA/NifB/PqqE/SkfB family radical SAM enzyme
MIRKASPLKMTKAMLSTPGIVLAGPRVIGFLIRYMGKFRTQDVGGNLIVHSHLPPINHGAYRRFVREHLLSDGAGPSHAQIGVTAACPQKCDYCYNKDRRGNAMDDETIMRTIRDLKALGVFWLGLTGGEPLLNRNLPRIVETAGGDCAVKLFTTGSTLTRGLASDLKNAGLFSVAVSLDHWIEERHDAARNTRGAFRTALRAIETFRNVEGLHVSVSAVLTKDMLNRETVEKYLEFLAGLGIHEAWLSEAKPSSAAFMSESLVVTDEERAMLIDVQDRRNGRVGMTVNYLGHFEDGRHFGCSAGNKMIYVDAFGEVSPCVFIPMTFGNVNGEPVREIYRRMGERFPTERACFINRNFRTVGKYAKTGAPAGVEDSMKLLGEIQFGPRAEFFRLKSGRTRSTHGG